MHKQHILLAEDEGYTRHGITTVLKRAGYKVTVEEDGKKALEKIKIFILHQEKVDLLLTDLHMPNLSGKGLIRELDKLNIDIPVIIITGFADQFRMDDYTNINCLELIEKPFVPHDLLNRVADVIEEHKRLCSGIKQN